MQQVNRDNCKSTLPPERIIQFGEGNFLRAFADWVIHRMNKRIGFNSGIVVVQPLPTGMADTLNEQEGLYHVNLQGINNGEAVDSLELIEAVTRAINPYEHFDQYLLLAEAPDIRFVLSNTTEAGIAFDPACGLHDQPATSYPGKLTQLLYHRYKTFGGATDKGWIIFPCELIFHNGEVLKRCIQQYIDLWQLEEGFRRWVNQSCGIYSTLVDRIVPGYPKETIAEITQAIGADDHLVVKGEIFHLWVIEAPKSVAEQFPASEAGLNVLFVDDEQPYHERKVTLLNGPHTVLSPVGYLSGLDTVRQCVDDAVIGAYVHRVIYNELLPTLNLPKAELEQFAGDVLNRFRNPYVNHFVTSIMLNSFPKYKTRDLPGLKRYYTLNGHLPAGLVLGLAGIITYYKGGKRGEEAIMPNDDPQTIALLQQLWSTNEPHQVATGVLGAHVIWGEDLNALPGLTALLTSYLHAIQEKGMYETVKTILHNG